MSIEKYLASLPEDVQSQVRITDTSVHIPTDLLRKEFYTSNTEEILEDSFTTEKGIYLAINRKGKQLKPINSLLFTGR